MKSDNLVYSASMRDNMLPSSPSSSTVFSIASYVDAGAGPNFTYKKTLWKYDSRKNTPKCFYSLSYSHGIHSRLRVNWFYFNLS